MPPNPSGGGGDGEVVPWPGFGKRGRAGRRRCGQRGRRGMRVLCFGGKFWKLPGFSSFLYFLGLKAALTRRPPPCSLEFFSLTKQ